MKKFFTLDNKSFRELKVKSYQELWEKVKSKGYDGLKAPLSAEFKLIAKSAEDKPKRFKVTLSSAKQDRHGDIVEQNFDLKYFKKNPVVLDSHRYDSIFRILGRMPKIGIGEKNLEGEIEFATSLYEGAVAEWMVENGFVNTVSIGFIPFEFDEKGRITKSELLECSLVSVPAQPEALFEHKSKSNDKKKDAEPEVKDEPKETEELVVDNPQKPVITEPKENILSKVAKELESNHLSNQQLLKNVAKELSNANRYNLSESKRKIYKSLRQILSKDNSNQKSHA